MKAFNEAENYNGPYPPRRRRARRGGYAGCAHHRVRAQALAVGFAVASQPPLRTSFFGASASSRVSTPRRAHIPRATASFAKRSGYRGAHQKAAVDSVHFPLWRYNPVAEGKKLVLDSADKSDTVSFAYPPPAVSANPIPRAGRLFAA